MISLANISKNYLLTKENKIQAVRDVSVEINKRDFVILTGRSGSGKTTLLNLLSGLTQPTSGKVMLDGIDLWSLSDDKQSRLRSQKFGFVFQFPSLLPSLNVVDNVALHAIFKNDKSEREAAIRRAEELLDLIGLQEKRTSFPRQLSAGQQQRVVIARALMNQPEILLADEPTSDLDEQTEQEIVDLITDIHQKTGVTIIMVTHALQLTSYGTRIIEMAQGEIIRDRKNGRPKAHLKKQVRRAKR